MVCGEGEPYRPSMRFGGLFVCFLLTACSSSSTPAVTADAGPGGGPVPGTAPDHCMGMKMPTDEAACHPTDAGTDAMPDHDAASDAMDDGMSMSGEFGPTMIGSEGDDDDCKYHLRWSVTPTHVNEDQTFTVTITRLADGKPATGAAPDLEVFLDETHPAPNSNPKAVETSTPGTYTVGPIRFDASGKWTVRFHVYEDCVDGETSPHGHAAFFVTVP
jgi:hypothetical protein